jgi:PAS domain S-box-containing protein
VTTRRLIALTLLLLAVLPLAILNFVSFRTDVTRERAAADARLEQAARSAADGLAERLDRLLDNMRADAATPALAEALMLARSSAIDARTINRHLLLVTLREPLYLTSVGLLDAGGRNLADTQPARVGIDESNERYVREVLRLNQPQLNGPLVPVWDTHPGLFATAPITAGGARTLGLLRARLEPALLAQVLARGASPVPDGVALLLDDAGIVLASTDPSWSATGKNLGAVPLPGQGAADFDLRGVAQRGHAHGVAQMPWRVVVAQSKARYEASVAILTREFVRSQVVLGLLLMVAVLPLARFLAGPAVRLAEAAESIAAGDHARRAAVAGPEEFQRLGRAFNLMNERSALQLQALSDEHDRLAATIEATRVGTWEWIPRTGEVTANDRFYALLGWRREEIGTLNTVWLRERTHPDDLALIEAALRRHFAHEVEMYEAEFRMRHRDGAWVWLLDRGRVWERNEAGAPLRMYGTRQDVSQRKQVEMALRDSEGRLLALNAHLESEVHARTAELAAARDVAEAASRAKSAFLANMSHEIRTPLNAIIGLTQLLQAEDPRPAQLDRLRKVGHAADHLLGLLNDVLDISKIEADKLTLESESVALEPLFERCCAMVREAADAKGLGLRAQFHGLPPAVLGDSARISQVVLNLLSNAIKFTAQGGVVLRAHPVGVAPESRLRIEVQDTGIGLDDDEQRRIFHPFEQADSSTTRRFGGTGLGLAISRRLVAMMGGSIGVHSAAGQGATFWVDLPLRPTVVPAAEVDAGHDAPGEPRLDGVHVLLAEDNEVNQEVARAILAHAGAVVDLAADGQSAVDLASGHRYDLILMDMQMPRMDGLEATRRIRNMPQHSRTPIVAMTANVFAEDQQACADAGMDDHLPKPMDARVMVSTVRRWVDRPAPHAS